MSRDIASKQRLLTWAEDQDLEFRTRYILEKLASFAGPDRTTWAPIAYLAKVAQCSERKVQYCLAKLKEEGLIEATGRRKRLDDSTRSVPVYRVAPAWNAEMTAPAMGADPAPIEPVAEGHGCTDDGVWVHRACTPKDLKDPTEFAIAHSAGEREALTEGYRELEAATPKRVLANTDPDEALAAYVALAADGVDVAGLPDCARRMAADPGFKSRKFPPGLQVWLAKRQYRGWLPDDPAPTSAAASGPVGFDPPEEVLAALKGRKGPGWVTTWLGQARWIGAERAILCRLKLQADRAVTDLGPVWLREQDLHIWGPADAAAHQDHQGALA